MHAKNAKTDSGGKILSSLCDVDVILGLSYILLLLKCVRALIKIALNIDIFVCDFVDSMKVVQQELYGSIVTHMLNLKTQHSKTSMPLKP
jgi:hypothetical protein